MEKEQLQQQIALYYSKLPSEAQEVFAKMEWLESLKQISTKYGLKDEQAQELGTETTLVLLGIIHTDEYEEKIKNGLGTSLEQAGKMLSEINDAILKNIRPQLLEAFNKNAKEAEQGTIEIEEGLDERFDKMPKELKKIIIESGYHAKLYAIATEAKLNIPQMGALEEAATGVITGATHPDQFENKIKEKMSLPSETVKKLVSDINEKILRPIREKMETTYSKPKIPTEIKPEIKPAGIRAIPIARKPDLSVPELAAGTKATPPPQKPVTPVSVPKLSGSFQSSTVKTDYTLKREGPNPVKNDVAQKNMDPYREIPE